MKKHVSTTKGHSYGPATYMAVENAAPGQKGSPHSAVPAATASRLLAQDEHWGASIESAAAPADTGKMDSKMDGSQEQSAKLEVQFPMMSPK